MNYKIWSAVSAFLFLICFLLVYFLYSAEKERTIEELNARQRIHITQAAKGLQDYIDMWVNQFSYIAQNESVARLTPSGKQIIDSFYEKEKDKIGSVVRVNDKGIITYAPPALNITGKDILYEKHIRDVIANRKPVISDIFFAVQGYNAIAIHVPVFDGGKFIGSLGGIIKVEESGSRFLEDIKIGESGYAWMISRDGTELWCPVPGHIGKSVYEIGLDFPEYLEMAKRMMAGETGEAVYFYDRIRDKKTEKVKKYAVFAPVKIHNTFWSVVASTAEEDVLKSLISFRNKLILVFFTFFAAAVFFAYYGMKTWAILKESKAKKDAEHQLQMLNSELENKVAQRTSQLEKINKDLESFTYTVSHDLRAPLRAINGFTQVLAEDYSSRLGSEGQGLIRRIKKSTEKMDLLIESILRLSRLNYQVLDVHEINLSPVAGSLAKDLQSLYPNVKYEIRIEEDIITRGDYGLLMILLDNLLKNAFKFSSKVPSPVIEFSCVEKEGIKVFCVKDNGAGFVGERDEKLFSPFKRFHSDYEFEGIGIGLAIVKKIVDKHKGTIWVESKPDKGAAFYFTLNA